MLAGTKFLPIISKAFEGTGCAQRLQWTNQNLNHELHLIMQILVQKLSGWMKNLAIQLMHFNI
jgi:hypothetical protein